jgi:hypothetical protein
LSTIASAALEQSEGSEGALIPRFARFTGIGADRPPDDFGHPRCEARRVYGCGLAVGEHTLRFDPALLGESALALLVFLAHTAAFSHIYPQLPRFVPLFVHLFYFTQANRSDIRFEKA